MTSVFASRPGAPYTTESPEMPRSARMFHCEPPLSDLRVKCVALIDTSIPCCSRNLAISLTGGVGAIESSAPHAAGNGAGASAILAVRGISKTWRSRGAADIIPSHLPSSSELYFAVSVWIVSYAARARAVSASIAGSSR